jgi:hypothetical protein
MSRGARTALVAAVVVIAIVAFIAVKPSSKSGSGSSSSSTSTTPAGGKAQPVKNVQVKDGKPVGGIQDLTFAKGGTVQFKVTSDVADEVHVHGYDFHKNVAPGHPITFRFPAKIDGEFVVELESRGEQIAALKVTP